MDTKAMRYGYGDRVGRTNCHECNEGLFYDDNGDNLKLSFAGATEMPRNIIAHELLGNIFFAHELHELTRRLCAKKNGDRVGRTNLH